MEKLVVEMIKNYTNRDEWSKYAQACEESSAQYIYCERLY